MLRPRSDQADEDAERALMARVASGDREAFRALAHEYVPRLVAYASRLLRMSGEAEDIVQEVLCRVWDHRAALTRVTSLRAYLFGAVRNAALNTIKHDRSEERWRVAFAREEAVPGMSTPSPLLDDALLHDELSVALRLAVDTLPERRRQILLLRLQQLTYGEIAAVMQISPKTVEAQVTQAFSALRAVLADWAK